MMCTPGTVMLLMLLRISEEVFLASETCSHSGWFGPNCVYKCHCQNDKNDKTSCDFTQGTCAEGSRCEDGYTGASCQYSNLAVCRNSYLVNCEGDQNSSVAVDGKDTTCITLRAMGPRDCSWSVNLTLASFVTQISVKIPPGAHDNYTWQVYYHNDRKITTKEARRQVSTDNDIVYFPPKNFLVTRVEIVAPLKSELKLCEVKIMGGRNIALKKKATQGENFNKSSGAEKAVDDEGKRSNKDQCAIAKAGTIPGQPLTSWWKVVLGQNVLAWQVEVHTCHECANVGLSMRLSNGSLVDLKYEVPRRAIIIARTDEPLQATELQVTKKVDSLTLCEVRVFGDCLDGYFGWLCEHRCNCSSPEEVCDKVWGTCRRPRCEMGWQGPRCQQACPRGFYGFQCSDKCSDNCVDGNCLHTDGSCTCKPGWEGYRCHHTCYPGSFGARCRERCNPNCVEGLCNHLDGACSKGCKPGWKGEMCQNKCEVTSGTSCTQQCQGQCLDKVCHSQTGECTHGCQSGWRGLHCVERDNKNSNGSTFSLNIIIIGGGAGGGLVIIIIIIVVVVKCRKSGDVNIQNIAGIVAEKQAARKSDSSAGTGAGAAGNDSKSGGSSARSSSSGSDKPSSNPNYTSTALQEVEIHAYMDLHTRDPTYAATASKKDNHTYIELRTKRMQSEPPQPPAEGSRNSAIYANQERSPKAPVLEEEDEDEDEANYYNTAS